jgi:hypothetical protein
MSLPTHTQPIYHLKLCQLDHLLGRYGLRPNGTPMAHPGRKELTASVLLKAILDESGPHYYEAGRQSNHRLSRNSMVHYDSVYSLVSLPRGATLSSLRELAILAPMCIGSKKMKSKTAQPT